MAWTTASARSIGGAPNRRCGVALAAALCLIAMLGCLVMAGMFTASRMRRASDLRLLDAALSADGDDLLFDAVERWSSSGHDRLPVGGADTVARDMSEPLRIDATVRTTRLSANIFWLVADLRAAADTMARRRVGLLVRLPSPPYTGVAPLASAGDVMLGASAHLLADPTPPTTPCSDDAGPAVAEVVAVAPGARVTLDSARANGDSVRVETSAALGDTATLLTFGAEDWAKFAAHADVRYAPDAVSEASAHTLAYAAGDFTLRGGSGSGVLIVAGRLTLDGPLTFSGVIVARGGIATAGDSAVVTGVVVSTATTAAATLGAATGEPPVALRHHLELKASRCIARAAMAAAGRPAIGRQRAWSELF